MIVPITTMRKNIRMNALPFRIASLAPRNAPEKLQSAIGKAYW